MHLKIVQGTAVRSSSSLTTSGSRHLLKKLMLIGSLPSISRHTSQNTVNTGEGETPCKHKVLSHLDLSKLATENSSPIGKNPQKYKSTIIQEDQNSARKKWKKINNVCRAISGFAFPVTRRIISKEELQSEFDNYQSPSKRNVTNQPYLIFDAVKENIEEFQKSESMYSLIIRGNPKDIIYLERMILNDTRIQLLAYDDKNNFINCRNYNGMTLLHVAVLNHNYIATEYLLNLGVNPYIMTINSKGKEEDNALDISCRWDFIKLVELLMSKVRWSMALVKKARKKTTNKSILMLLTVIKRNSCCGK